jgi:hypothetical protein
MQHTSSAASKGVQESNPLHLHFQSLNNYVQGHGLELPKVCIQIHADLCQHDPPVCDEPCDDEDHAQGQYGGGANLPLFSMPEVSEYSAEEDKMRYHWLEEQQNIVTDPATQ